MTYYCEECERWINSKYDAEYQYHNGRKVIHRWCDYDRKMRACDQEVYRCSGFIYVRRAVLTKICEILNINPSPLFSSFDETKENYLMPNQPELLASYNDLASYIVNGLDVLPNKEDIAKVMLNSYIIDAEANVKRGDYCKAVTLYSEMIKVLRITFDVINDRSKLHVLTK